VVLLNKGTHHNMDILHNEVIRPRAILLHRVMLHRVILPNHRHILLKAILRLTLLSPIRHLLLSPKRAMTDSMKERAFSLNKSSIFLKL
jgi:hypothetical protein